MAGSILTPVSVWNDFDADTDKTVEIVSENVVNGVILSRFYINGRKIGDKRVRIYAVSARGEELVLEPAVYVLPSFTQGINEEFLLKLAKSGYFAIATDFTGKADDKKVSEDISAGFTEYPEEVAYANYEFIKDRLFEIEDDVKKTAWYEWGCVAKYTINYIRALPFITVIGAVGIGTGASVLWHAAANEDRLSAAAFLFDAGWNAYFRRKDYKFDAKNVEFDDSELKYLAGVDAQAYASFIKVPSLILTATNSDKFDFDRAYDTLTRITPSVYRGIDYSVGAKSVLDKSAYFDLICFLESVLIKGVYSLPAPPDIDCDVNGGKLEVDVDASTDNLKKVIMYVAEDTVDPSTRSWSEFSEIIADEQSDGKFFFEYTPCACSDKVFVFVRAEYDNGYTVSSNVICKDLSGEKVKGPTRSNVIFSGRVKYSETAFSCVYDNFSSFADEKKSVILKKGPMGILGITSDEGLITYKINAKKDKPNDDSVMLIDVYTENGDAVKISLLSDEEYFAEITTSGKDAWKNVCLPVSAFKNKQGKQLRNYGGVKAIKITSAGKFLINNFLWA